MFKFILKVLDRILSFKDSKKMIFYITFFLLSISTVILVFILNNRYCEKKRAEKLKNQEYNKKMSYYKQD